MYLKLSALFMLKKYFEDVFIAAIGVHKAIISLSISM